MRYISIILLIVMLPFQYGCKEKLVRYSDSGATVHLKADQILKVELPGNTSTGNDWRKVAYDDNVIIKKGKPNYMLADDRIGSAGVYYFKFRAVAPGVTKLYMEYGSKYDDEKEPVKIFELEVVVVGG